MIEKITKKRKSVRLPAHISPIHYKLSIHPDILSFTFTGKEEIKIKIDKETNKITLHSKDIDIETVKYKSGKTEQFASKISYDTEAETATFHFKNKIKKGQGELHLVFSGIISDSLRGFYRSKYIVDGEEKYLATTQFEATDARRAFPCFDEPAHKAVFELSMITEDRFQTISNTLPIEVKEHSAGYKITKFAPSPKMSTYLLAFIVGEFEYVEGKTKDGVQVRVFTTSGKKSQALFALEVAIKSLEFYNKYFDIEYPLPILDLIAIPDFESGAMENWGAVTFRETALLVDEEHSSLSNKQWVALVVAHELAHQWFGNLVTMHWWTDLWLNEGFASYMEYLCIDDIFPDWNIWELFLASNRYKIAIKTDALKNSHPIEVDVHHPNEINEVFDFLSYEKGSAIIRLLSEYLGEYKFRDGLRYYLKKHSYSNTKTEDLWNAFERVSGKSIRKMMSSWTKQMGFPVVEASYDKNHEVDLKQERFFLSRVSRKNNKEKKIWQIPISYSESEKVYNTILMDKKYLKITSKNIGKINNNEVSFIKVKYSKEILNSLKNQIIDNKIGTIDKLGIIRDIFDLAEGGYIKTSEALEFSLIYKNEAEFIIWSEIASGINRISNIIDNDPIRSKFEKYVLSLFSPIAIQKGFKVKKNENNNDTFLRSLALSQATNFGDKLLIKEAQKIFNNRDNKIINPNIRSIVYSTVAKNGGSKEYKMFKKMYRESSMQEEKERCAMALTQFKDPKIIEENLSFILNSGEIREQDVLRFLSVSWKSRHSRDLTWKFIKDNWNKLLKKYGGTKSLSHLLDYLGEHISTKDLREAKKFFAKNIAPGAERTLLQAYERIESNAAWWKEDKKDITNWLNKNY